MKLTVLFLFVAIIIAIQTALESVKKFLDNEEFAQAMTHQYINYVWPDMNYGAIR